MPKPKSPKLLINLDLLKPQSNPEQLVVKLFRWLLSTGRYIFILVEAVVLIAFITRFKLDEDLASKNEAIKLQIPYIKSLKSTENLIKQTQLKLSTLSTLKNSNPDYAQILERISSQIPPGVKVTNLTMNTTEGNTSVQFNAQTQTNNDLSILLSGLKNDQIFSEVNISSIGFEKGIIVFSISTQVKKGVLKS